MKYKIEILCHSYPYTYKNTYNIIEFKKVLNFFNLECIRF